MPEHEPLDYRLRCHTKRTDLPPDVLRDIGEAYEYMQLLRDELTERIHMCDMRSEKILELTAERDEVMRLVHSVFGDDDIDEAANTIEQPHKEDGK